MSLGFEVWGFGFGVWGFGFRFGGVGCLGLRSEVQIPEHLGPRSQKPCRL